MALLFGNVSGGNQTCGANYGNSHLDRRIWIRRLWRGGLLICKKTPAGPLMRPCVFVFAINPPPSQQANRLAPTAPTHRSRLRCPPPLAPRFFSKKRKTNRRRPPLEPRPRAGPRSPLSIHRSAATPRVPSARRPRSPRLHAAPGVSVCAAAAAGICAVQMLVAAPSP
jgi:hypothetical protein